MLTQFDEYLEALECCGYDDIEASKDTIIVIKKPRNKGFWVMAEDDDVYYVTEFFTNYPEETGEYAADRSFEHEDFSECIKWMRDNI